MFVLCLSLNFMVTVFHPFNFYYICFFLQSGGNSIAMDANATAHLHKLWPSAGKYKFLCRTGWPGTPCLYPCNSDMKSGIKCF